MKRSVILVLSAFMFVFCPVVIWSQVVVSTKLVMESTALAGQSYPGIVGIKNIGGRDERVTLYLRDYIFSADGSNIFGEPGTTQRSNAAWIQLKRQEVKVAPGQTQEVEFAVTVPANENLSGSYWSLLMVESITASVRNPEREEDEVGVVAGVRFGIQVVTNIGDTGRRRLSFLNAGLDRKDGAGVFRVDVENDGERRLTPKFYLELYGEEGTYEGRYNHRSIGLYPGSSTALVFPLEGAAAGKYYLMVVADAGGSDVFGAQYSVEVPK